MQEEALEAVVDGFCKVAEVQLEKSFKEQQLKTVI